MCMAFLDENAETVIKWQQMLMMPMQIIEIFLYRSKVRVGTEMLLYDFAIRWAEWQCLVKNVPITVDNVRDALGKLIQRIRFVHIEQQCFEEQIVPSGILTQQQIADIRPYLLPNYRGMPLPKTLRQFNTKPRKYLYSATITIEIENLTNFLGPIHSRAFYTCGLNWHMSIAGVAPWLMYCNFWATPRIDSQWFILASDHLQDRFLLGAFEGEINPNTNYVQNRILIERRVPPTADVCRHEEEDAITLAITVSRQNKMHYYNWFRSFGHGGPHPPPGALATD
ncbi:hypothetical protein niasHT_000908 [Heterodera trifolii]|uniref:BACK domain-containing protein n=1 Tax=Heterodera trifolii TaxID=157864 RepID=A0ABD2LS59_9BILA